MISFESFTSIASTIETGANNCEILIPARYSSLKTLFTIMRLQANIGTGAHTKKTLTNRMNILQDGGQLYYSIGGTNLPSTSVKTSTNAAAELCKPLHVFGAQRHKSDHPGYMDHRRENLCHLRRHVKLAAQVQAKRVRHKYFEHTYISHRQLLNSAHKAF